LIKCYPFIVPALALALLITLPGPFVVARGPHSEIQQAGDLTCQFVQRGFFGQVADGYIWETTPGSSYNNDSLYTGSIGSGERRSLIRFGLDFLPAGAVIRSALFGLWETSAGSGQTVTLYRVTAAWSEGQPTWNNFAENYDSAVTWGRFTANGPGVLMADVTGLVAAWAGGSVPNYGLLLKNTSGQALDRYASSDSGQFYKPGLLVCYEVSGPPNAEDDAATTDEDTPVDVNVLDNDSDPDGDALTVSDYDSSSTQGGPVSCTGAGVCTYTPPTGFTGTDVFTYTASDGHGGTATASVSITVTATPPTEHLLYMPIVMKAYGLPPGPDLIVERIEVTGSHVLVVIRNQGTLPVPVENSFWVDLYVDPDPAPTRVNQTWPMLCDLGAAWGVTAPALPLPPGGTLTLTIGDPYYQADDSNFPASLPAGTPIYVQVDSANVGTTYGAVLENHEMAGWTYNNVGGPVLSTLNAMEEGTATEAHPPTPSGWLPPRP